MAFLGPSLRRTKVTDRPGRRVAVAVLVSLLVNAGTVLLLAAAGAFRIPKPVESRDVALAELSTRDWESNRKILGLPGPSEPLQKREPPPAPPEKVKDDDERKQVVDVAPSKDSRPPPEARFHSERNNRVEKETRSRWQGTGTWRNRAPLPIPGQEGKKNGGHGGADDETREARQGHGGTNEKGGRERSGGEARVAPEGDRVARLDRPALPRTSPEPPRAGGGTDQGSPGLPGDAQEGKQKSGDPRLLPSVEDMSRIAAGPSMDALPKDIEEGDATALNTKAFVHSTFWNRFKQDLGEHWLPVVRYEILERDPTAAIYGRNDRVTGLRIVLDAGGAVKKIEVVESCGIAFLDQLAVKAVRDASPYYNVPPGLLDANGELAFSFGFSIERNRGIPIRPRYDPGR